MHVLSIQTTVARIAACVIVLLYANIAAATNQYRTVVNGVYDPSTPANPATLYGADFEDASPKVDRVTVTCYYPLGESAICGGGGEFDLHDCGNDTNNFTTVVREKTGEGQCWYRKNFGLNDVVDARQCGVRGDGIDLREFLSTSFDDADRLQACVGLARITATSSLAPAAGP